MHYWLLRTLEHGNDVLLSAKHTSHPKWSHFSRGNSNFRDKCGTSDNKVGSEEPWASLCKERNGKNNAFSPFITRKGESPTASRVNLHNSDTVWDHKKREFMRHIHTQTFHTTNNITWLINAIKAKSLQVNLPSETHCLLSSTAMSRINLFFPFCNR